MDRKVDGGVFKKAACLFLAALLLAGCGRGVVPSGSKEYVCYVNADGTGLVRKEYETSSKGVKSQIAEMLRELQKETDELDYKSALPKDVHINGWSLTDSDLEIDFSKSYGRLDASEELLLRAATVYTLVQIGGVDYVKFTVEGKELHDGSGKPVGYMNQDMFVENVGSSLHSFQDGNIRLYFANEAGDKLKKEEVSIRYNSNMSVEKLIVDQLIKGPAMSGAYPTIPPETKVLGVSVRDGTCYVNFDEEFLNTTYHVSPEAAVYSVVNSLVDAGETSQVQILVNGRTDTTYRNVISLEKPFSRNLEIVEEEEP